MAFIVTVKLPKNPEHNPHNKITGTCPVTRGLCTDVTGEHHSVIAETQAQIEQLRSEFEHITRIEEV